MSRSTSRSAGPLMPEAEIVENDSIRIAGIRHRLRAVELRAWTRRTLPAVSSALRRSGLRPRGAPIAMLRPVDDGGFEAFLGYPVDATPWGAELEHETIPAGEAARAVHFGPYESVLATYDRLFEWVVGHGRTPEPLMWEQYVVGPPLTQAPQSWRTVVMCRLRPVHRSR